MKRLLVLFAACVWAATSVVTTGSQAAPRPQPAQRPGPALVQPQNATLVAPPDAVAQYGAVLKQYCVGCHNDRLKTAGLALDTMDLTKVHEGAAAWEKVIRRLRVGSMPPSGMPRPDAATYQTLASWLETTIDRASTTPNPGRPALYRLNRGEYANAIRDLLALEVDATTLLPADDSSFGFDNIADVLVVSSALQDSYLSAAAKVSALAVGDPAMFDQTYPVPADLTQNQHIEGLPLGTRGGMVVTHMFPADGEYLIRAKMFRTNEGNPRGIIYAHRLIMTIDGEQVFESSFGGPEDLKLLHESQSTTITTDAIDERMQVRVPVKAGPRRIGVTFVQRNEAERPDLLQPFLSTFDQHERGGLPKIDSFRITGPSNPLGLGDTPSRRRIFTCRPTAAADEAPCARTILSSLARRAYRRPATEGELASAMRLYQTGRQRGTFDTGIQLGLRYILASPQFTFRTEQDPPNVALGSAYQVSDLELASRLAFFLWSSIPDDELLEAASRGTLRAPATLARQVRRMLDDPRSQALSSNFAGQWLYLRNLRTARPDLDTFPNFDDNLRVAFRRETELLFETIMHEDRSVLELLNANYTFVNERLAKHYGIPEIYGSHFRRVPVPTDARRGLLGHGSILTVTSRPERTSPVLRGKWILENMLGTPPPPPPPNVPPLEDATNGDTKPRTLREEMEMHRASPACAGCHNMMDPLGFALENFDAVGAWRERQNGIAIDASGRLANGTAVEGVVGLRQALLQRPNTFVQTMTEKLLTYAVGRGLVHYDMPTVRAIVEAAGRNDYRFSSLILGVVSSPAFQMKVKMAQEPGATRAARE